jgi:uncharacterized repeat protein (TIGR01451 family)
MRFNLKLRVLLVLTIFAVVLRVAIPATAQLSDPHKRSHAATPVGQEAPSDSHLKPKKTEVFKGKKVAAGEVLVKFRPSATKPGMAQAELIADADRVRKVGGTGAKLIHSRSKDTATLVQELSARGDVVYAEPNYVVHADALPGDPKFSELWGLQNTGYTSGGGAGTAGADIDAAAAWEISTGSRDNVVAVVDTGIDSTHPDLAANMWSAPAPFTVNIGGQTIQCAAGTHGFNAITKTCDPKDEYNHGTHVAGTIGAVGNNGVGGVGVNWTASIMDLKFMDATGRGDLAGAIDAIEFAIQAKQAFAGTAGANVRVLSNSWGWNGDFSQALLDQINRANSSDMLFVASTGNGGEDRVGDNNDTAPFYPSSYTAPNVIAVAATDNNDALASFSNYGANSAHLGAPGVLIYSTIMGGLYDYWSGTSMASPHVSGAAALVLSRCALDTAALKENLLNNADPIPALSGVTMTGRRLNVNNALLACGAAPAGLSLTLTDSPDPATASSDLTYTLTVTNEGLSAATGVTFVSATSSQGTCSGTGTITCALESLASSATATISIVVKPTAIGKISNTASVSSLETDPNISDNSATAVTTVLGSLTSLTLNPISVTGSKASIATITLNEPAPSGGAVVRLSSSNTAVAAVPTTFTLAAGTTTKSFTFMTRAVAVTSTVDITAAYGGNSKSATLTVHPPALSTLVLSPATLNSPCQSASGKVTLNAVAPAGGILVALTSSNAAAKVPASVTVPAGTTSATFTVTPALVSTRQTSTVTASYGGVSKSSALTLLPIGVASLTLTPNPVTGPNEVTGTITLTCPAPSGGLAVRLTTSNSAIARPKVSTVTIPAGAKTGTFTVITADVSKVNYVTISAGANAIAKSVRLTVN